MKKLLMTKQTYNTVFSVGAAVCRSECGNPSKTLISLFSSSNMCDLGVHMLNKYLTLHVCMISINMLKL